MATGALSLGIARVFVGFGEASYTTIAPTIIDDIAPGSKKSTWLAIFYAACPIGAALGYVTGGLVEKAMGWRAAFLVAGVPGLVLGTMCFFLVDPARRAFARPGPVLSSVRPLLGIPLYVRGVLGYAPYTFAVGGFAYWGPAYLFERFEKAGLSLSAANLGMGAVTVLGGALGTAIGGFWGDRAVQVPASGRSTLAAGPQGQAAEGRRRVSALLRVCAIGSLIGAPFAALAIVSPTPTLFFLAFFGCEVAIFLSTSPINAAMLDSVPSSVRASAMAICIFGIHALGDLWSPPGIGVLADHTSMPIAMLVLPVAILVSGVVWWPPRAVAAT